MQPICEPLTTCGCGCGEQIESSKPSQSRQPEIIDLGLFCLIHIDVVFWSLNHIARVADAQARVSVSVIGIFRLFQTSRLTDSCTSVGAKHCRSLGQPRHGTREYLSLSHFVPNNELDWFQTAIINFEDSGERRHGACITPQAEKPIPALDSPVVP
jgi:hypothetical protein